MKKDLTTNVPRIRIAWRDSEGKRGHGEWQPEFARKDLMQWITEMKKDCPDMTHWIESEDI